MNLLQVDPTDISRLAGFRCSTGPPFEEAVEAWIRREAGAWLNDIPLARYQRRAIAIAEDDANTVAVVAWRDIVRLTVDGIWLEALAVAIDHQHHGHGRAVYDLTVEHLRTLDHNGDHLAGAVHVDNLRSQQLLTSAGWRRGGPLDDHHDWWIDSL